jgi:pyruvate dehydrogenase E1 component
MYVEQESVFYYLTVENEPYPMPAMPEGCRDGILRGLYRVQPSASNLSHRAQVLGSGAILLEAIKAQTLLERYDVSADVWSVTSWAQLYRDGHDCDRWNMLHPLDTPRKPYVTQCLATEPGVVVAASDYLKALPDSLSQWLDKPLVALGTDGFGRSESRADLRSFFEVDARFITLATLRALARDGAISPQVVAQALTDLEIDPDKAAPMIARAEDK